MTPFTIQMNTQKGPTADLNFRKAVAYAFDYDALLQIENGAAKLLDSPFPNAMTGHVAIADIPRRDLDKAREYLAKTQWPKGGVELDYTYVAGLEVERRIGLALLESLQPLDIKVNVVAQPWPTLIGRGAKPETASDLVAVYVTPVSPDADVLAAQYCLDRRRAVLGDAPAARPATGRDGRRRAAGERPGQADDACTPPSSSASSTCNPASSACRRTANGPCAAMSAASNTARCG